MKWDRQIPYEETRAKLAAEILKERDLVKAVAEGREIDPFAVVRLGWLECYLTQIVAGSRASEALDAFNNWVKTGEREMRVRVRKRAPPCKTCGHLKTSQKETTGHLLTGVAGERGKCKKAGCSCFQYVPNQEKAKTRLIAIPEQCLQDDRASLFPHLETRTVNAYKKFARRRSWLGNTHSARYSLMNKMKADGYSTTVISKTTGQTESQAEAYFDEQEAEKLLRERAKAPIVVEGRA